MQARAFGSIACRQAPPYAFGNIVRDLRRCSREASASCPRIGTDDLRQRPEHNLCPLCRTRIRVLPRRTSCPMSTKEKSTIPAMQASSFHLARGRRFRRKTHIIRHIRRRHALVIIAPMHAPDESFLVDDFILVPSLSEGDIVVMDNLPAHKVVWRAKVHRSRQRKSRLPSAIFPRFEPHRDGLRQTQGVSTKGRSANS